MLQEFFIKEIVLKLITLDIDWNNFLREKIRAEYVLYKSIYDLRISSIFDIIRDYPLTKSAVNDFHVRQTMSFVFSGERVDTKLYP